MVRRSWKQAALALVTAGTMVLTAQPAWALTEAPDQTWRTNGRVYALARVGNTLFAGGKFTRVISPDGSQKVKVYNLAAFDMTTGEWIASFAPTVENTLTTAKPQVRALDVSTDGSTLYVGGRFDTVNGVGVSNFAAVDATLGASASGFTPPVVNKPVNAILASPSLVYIGGVLTKVNDIKRLRLAAIAPDGSLDPDWVPSANNFVRSLTFAADGGSIFVGGKYTTMNGQPRASVSQVSLDTGAVTDWAVPAGVIDAGNPAWDMIATPDRLYGGFGNGPNYLAAFRLDNGNTGNQVWRFSTVGNVNSLAMSPDGSKLFFGGHFGTARLQQAVCGGTKYLRGLASVNPANGQLDCSWIPQIVPYGSNYTGGWAMLQAGSQLWVGGFFTSISDVKQSGIARFTL